MKCLLQLLTLCLLQPGARRLIFGMPNSLKLANRPPQQAAIENGPIASETFEQRDLEENKRQQFILENIANPKTPIRITNLDGVEREARPPQDVIEIQEEPLLESHEDDFPPSSVIIPVIEESQPLPPFLEVDIELQRASRLLTKGLEVSASNEGRERIVRSPQDILIVQESPILEFLEIVVERPEAYVPIFDSEEIINEY